MSGNVEGLLHAMIRLKEILERMPNAFHSISTNPNSGDNYVSATEWVRWGKFSAPLSKRCPAASGLQFPPYLVMDAFLGRKKYDSFLGGEGLHLRAWLPSNLRAFIASIEYHYRVPEFVKQSGDPRLMGVLDGIIEAYTGERGFMGTHRYKVFGILEVASKTGRTETNGNSGGADSSGRPWEVVHRQFSDAMKERLEPYRGVIPVEPHQMRGTFEECRYGARILNRDSVDTDPERSIAMVTLDIHDTGITYQPGDRLAIMPLNGWEECAKVAAALGLDDMLNMPVQLDAKWLRFAEHFGTIAAHSPGGSHSGSSSLTVKDILRRGHLAPLTQDLALKIHSLLHASSNTILQVLATDEWPVRGTLGDLLQAAVMDTPAHIWDRAFDLSAGGVNGLIPWLTDIISIEVPRTYSISSSIEKSEVLPSTIQLTISRAEYKLCDTFAGNMDVRRAGVSSGFLNPLPASDEYSELEDDEDLLLVGISRPMTFQLPLDGGAPCAYFAGGSGIAPFRSFWQSRIASGSVGRNILYLGVQSREKFCYEDELRPLVSSGHMEVHVAFSRDDRGLAYDPYRRDLVERRTPPRYIDALIADDQGATVCDLVMSKKQGGLGGYLYICGSVAVFDSIMSGIRRAIYNHRTATVDSTDLIIDTAFAERRIMLDVFMTPKPLPCNLPTIPLSELALHTGHRPDGRTWIAVHGSVYDVTDFCSMHPGGTLIIKSNAGVDCSKSFDNLGHTNNPEVASLLTKYFVGHLTPKPDFGGRGTNGPEQDLSGLYDLWADYLRTTVETLVSQQFEMDDLMGSSKLWYQGNMINILGVRIFYQYQSRLLQSGFSGLFGAKFQELVLKLSFAMVNAASLSGSDLSSETKLPDILGIVARAKTSADATATSAEVSLIGEYVCNGAPARFQERGIMDYANKSVQLDMELLEDIREEACRGMEAFGTIMSLEQNGDDVDSGAERVTAMCSILMHILERMARRLEVFYSKLSQHTIYQPEIEHNPARTRWGLVRRRIRDGSLFVLATKAGSVPEVPSSSRAQRVDFQSVLSRVQRTIQQAAPRPAAGDAYDKPLSEIHHARTLVPADAPSAVETYENTSAARRMSAFIDSNKRAMRRLSRVPTTSLEMTTLGQMLRDADGSGRGSIPTPPASSPESSPSPSKSLASGAAVEDMMTRMKLNRRPTSRVNSFTPDVRSRGGGGGGGGMMMRGMMVTPERTRSNSPTQPGSHPAVPSAMMKMGGRQPLNTRSHSSVAVSSVSEDVQAARDRSRGRSSSTEWAPTHRPRASTNTLRSFQLGRPSRAASIGRFAPTF